MRLDDLVAGLHKKGYVFSRTATHPETLILALFGQILAMEPPIFEDKFQHIPRLFFLKPGLDSRKLTKNLNWFQKNY